MKEQYTIGWIDTKAGKVPRVNTHLNLIDKFGTLMARLTFGRMNYKVDPGLYAVGNPTSDSSVFVSANYKMSFDFLRRELNGLDAWIMVIDTKGINVWCAAGKGTFGTQEIVNRIKKTELEKIVRHRKLIVPQLGAPGVAAYEVKKRSGFAVIYGPIRSHDIPAFLESGMRATHKMRQVRFSFYDRLVLVPAEISGGRTYLFYIIVAFLLLSGLSKNGYSTDLIISNSINNTMNLILAYIAGTALGPLLLPWLPGRSFSIKGYFAGLIALAISFHYGFIGTNFISIIAWMLLIPAIASFATMNFTGASTYTSLSGVLKEMRIAIPLQLITVVLGAGFWIISRFV